MGTRFGGSFISNAAFRRFFEQSTGNTHAALRLKNPLGRFFDRRPRAKQNNEHAKLGCHRRAANSRE